MLSRAPGQEAPFVWPADDAAVRCECFVESDLPASSPVLHETYLYWRSKHRAGRLPGRAQIDPVDLRGLLPSLQLAVRSS